MQKGLVNISSLYKCKQKKTNKDVYLLFSIKGFESASK